MYDGTLDNEARQLAMALIGIEPGCPRCGAAMTPRVRESFLAGRRVQCGQCEWYGNWRYGTLLEGSRISNVQFLALFFKYSLPNDAPAIAERLGLDPGTVRQWRDRILGAVTP